MRYLPAGFALALAFTAPAMADDIGIPVTVQVTDTEGMPIATAVVRHPSEQDRHRVNTETGKWVARVLYLPNGDELVFEKGMELEFEISAPGYKNLRVTYFVRKRKNVVPVVLEKMDFDLDSEEEIDDPVIQFGRDKPID
jgi:hypothetical protein